MAQWEARDRLFLTDLAMEVDVAGKGLGTPGRLNAVALSALEKGGNAPNAAEQAGVVHFSNGPVWWLANLSAL